MISSCLEYPINCSIDILYILTTSLLVVSLFICDTANTGRSIWGGAIGLTIICLLQHPQQNNIVNISIDFTT